MNIKSIYFGCAALALAGTLVGCNDDFLDVQPITDISDVQLMDPSVAQVALDGLFESMNTPYEGIDFNQNTGEAYTNYVFNDCMGNDWISGMWNNPNQAGLDAWSRMNVNNQWTTGFPWAYYYNLVAQANRLCDALPFTSEEEADPQLQFIKASALTMRAHAYNKLLVYYANRWEDSSNGEAYCIPLRLTASEGESPLVKMNDVLDQIYADCDEALALYAKSGRDRSNKWETNGNVAHGIKARTALLKHDWQTAADEAELAMQGFTVMEGDDLFAGFYKDCTDFIWHCNPAANQVYYWSWGCHYACNGHYINSWGMGGGAIDMTLYRLLDENDLRRKYYWTPDKLEALSTRQNPGKLKAASFWDEKMVSPENFLNMNYSNVYSRNGKNKNYGMIDAIVNWLEDYRTNVFTGDLSEMVQDDGFYNYFFITPGSRNKDKSVRLANDANGNQVWGTPTNIQFGAQCKFWGNVPYGNSALPWMRASEMALTRAEALAELALEGKGTFADAAQEFEAFQKLRVPGYTCTSTGTALLEEIRVSRRAELLGEGHNFTDFKRWNLPHIHKEWVAGDVNSGNWSPGALGTEASQSTKYSNGWRFALPVREFQYNPAIDLSLLPVIN